MSTMVSARVPTELYEQVGEMLQDAGATTTQLINGAFRQFRDTGRLPGEGAGVAPGARSLSARQRDNLARSIRDTTRKLPESYFADATYDELLERELGLQYEPLA